MTDEVVKKKARASRTMWLAVATAAAGAALTAAPSALPPDAAGPGLMLIAMLNAVLRVLTTQPVR